MSSSYVRTQIKTWLTTNASGEDVVDLTAAYEDLHKALSEQGIQPDSPWLGLEFIGDIEEPVSLAANNDQGLYREYGSVHFHAVDVAKLGIGDTLLTRLEALRDALRGQRIGDIVIESMTLPSFDAGSTLQFEGGFQSGTFIMGYYRDLNI